MISVPHILYYLPEFSAFIGLVWFISISCSFSIEENIEERQLRCFGHIIRMQKDRVSNKVYEVKSVERRGRGRPRRTWEEEIRKYLGKREVRRLLEIARKGRISVQAGLSESSRLLVGFYLLCFISSLYSFFGIFLQYFVFSRVFCS